MVGEKSQGGRKYNNKGAMFVHTSKRYLRRTKNTVRKNGHLQNWDEFWLDDADLSLSGLLEVFFFGNLNWNIL